MSDKSDATIEERENGRLVAIGLTSMKGENGEDLETRPSRGLCRCGHSKNKPFCDGSHNKVEFKSRGGEPAGRDRLITYEGAEISLTYNPRLCSHAAECSRLAPHIFDSGQKPWIQPDKGTADEIRAVIAACPSGALALAGGEHIIADRAEVEVEKDGPLWITGPRIDAPSAGEGASKEKYVLCRCGLSGNKPFCDGTHKDRGWKSSE
ncbi:MAG: CDGSH iron-sulfur domain-containing protein [Paracoccaceae bacterium]